MSLLPEERKQRLVVLREGPLRISRETILQAWKRRAPGTRIMIRDAWCRGLMLVVNATGLAWRFDYTPKGMDPATGRRWNTRSFVFRAPDGDVATSDGTASGPVDGMIAAPEFARERVAELKAIIRRGGDPAVERQHAARQAAQARANTLDRLIEIYAGDLPKRQKLRGSAGTPSPGHVAGEVRALRKAIDEMEASALTPGELERAAIQRMLGRHGEHPAAARARFGALNRFCDWLIDKEFLTANPCSQVAKARRPRAPSPRGTYLRPGQLGALWRAAAALDPVRRDFLRFLMAIPCRRGEATGLCWHHLDLRAAIWSQPERTTKNDEPHRFYLHPLALAVLHERRREAGDNPAGLVFVAPRSRTALTTWRDMKADLVAASGIDGWRLHDFRRSFATALGEDPSEDKVAEPVIDAVLNHRQSATRGGVLGTYQRAVRWPEQAKAMRRWGEILATAVEGAGAGPANDNRAAA